MGMNHIALPPYEGKAVATAGEANLPRSRRWLGAAAFALKTQAFILHDSDLQLVNAC